MSVLIKLCQHERSTSSVAQMRATTMLFKRICEHRISTLELGDMSTMFFLMVSILRTDQSVGAVTEQAASDILFNSISAVSTMISFRKAAVTAIFPSIIAFLREVFNILRVSSLADHRAKARQTGRMLPAWAMQAPAGWLRPASVKMFTRLLTALGARSADLQTRNRKGSEGTAIASLAGPLSKHSPFIVASYLSAAVDFDLPIASDIRRELLPGLIELLGFIGKHEREALMRGFLTDNMQAERSLLRAMWQEHEQTRYRGN